MNNNLILRTLTSPYGDATRGSVLSHEDVDNNFIFLKGRLIQTGTTANNNILLTSLDGGVITIPINFSGGTINNALNGLSVSGQSNVLGQTVGQAGNPAQLLYNTEIPLSGFSLFFRSNLPSNSVSIVPVSPAGAILNVGTDNHFSHSTIVGNRQMTITGTTNVNSVTDTGGYSSAYFDNRYTYSNGTTIAFRNPGETIVGFDLNDSNLTYNSWTGSQGYPTTWGSIQIGGFRRKSGAIGTSNINFPSDINSTPAVTRIQFDVESGGVITVTGNSAALAVGTRFGGASPGSTFGFYTDVLLGNDHGTIANIQFNQKSGLYILPIKTSTITNAYGIFQAGLTDANVLMGNTLVGTATDNGQKLQVSGNSAIFATANTVQQLIRITSAQTYSVPFFQVQDANNNPIFAINTLSNTNLYFGVNTGIATTTGQANIAIGGLGFLSASTFMNNTTGNQNMAIGCRTLAANTTGNANTAVGDAALFGNVIGSSNVAIGQAALAFNTGNSFNIGIGQNAGHGAGSNYDRTILIGSTVFNVTSGGSDCIVIGNGALSTRAVAQGDGTIVIGSNAGHFSQFGGNNIILGFNAHSSNDMGNSNISIGPANSFTGAGVNNTTLIGSGMTCNLSNVVGLGRLDQNILIGQTSITVDNGAKLQISGDTYINSKTAQPLNIDGGGNLLMQIGGPLGNSSALFGRFSNETLVSSSGGAFNVYLQGTKVYTTSRFVVNTTNDNSSTLQVHGAPSLTGFSLTSATIETNWSTSGSPVLIQGNVVSTSAFTSSSKLLDLTVNGNSLFKIGAYGQISATTSVPTGQTFTGAWTATSDFSYNTLFSGSFTSFNNENAIQYGTVFSPTLITNPSVTGNSQTLTAVKIAPTFIGTASALYALESGGNINMSSVDPIIRFGANIFGTGAGGSVFYMRNGSGYGMDITPTSFSINSQGSISLGSQATDTNIFFLGRQDVDPLVARTFVSFRSPSPSGISPFMPTSGTAKFLEIGAGNTIAGFATFQPSAGTATYTSLSVNDYVAQTGTSNGSVTMLDMTMNGNIQGQLYGIRVNNSNALNTFAGRILVGDGLDAAPSYSFINYPNTGFHANASGSPAGDIAVIVCGNTVTSFRNNIVFTYGTFAPITNGIQSNGQYNQQWGRTYSTVFVSPFGTETNPNYNFQDGSDNIINNGMFGTAGFLGFATISAATTGLLGMERMRITNNGNVLVNTKVDNGAKHQVNGNQSLGVLITGGSITLSASATQYVYTGTGSTWTLPAVSITSGWYYFIKNRGAGVLTLNSNSGGNDIYTSSAVNTLSFPPGAAYMLFSDGTFWNVQ